MTALLAQTHNRIAAGDSDSERVDRDVRAAAGEIENRAYRIHLLGVNHVRRAHALGELEAGRLNIDADDVRSHGGRDVDRRETDATAPVDDYPFAGLHLRAIDDAVKRGHEATAQRGCLDEVNAVGQIDQVHVGKRHRHKVTESAGVREARQQRRDAYVGLAVATILAGAVALAERNDHPLALFEIAHVLAYFFDDASELMSEDRAGLSRETHPGPVARPCVPVGTADAVGLDAHDGASGRAFGIGNGFNDERLFG